MIQKKSFLLVEFLIALTIFTIFLSAISKLQVQSLQLRDLAQKRSSMLEVALKNLNSSHKDNKYLIKVREHNNYANLKNFKLKQVTVSCKALTGNTCKLEISSGEELC